MSGHTARLPRVKLLCKNCNDEFEDTVLTQRKRGQRKFCSRTCAVSHQLREAHARGKRNPGRVIAELNRKNKGRSNVERFGLKKATEISEKLSRAFRGHLNPSFGKVYMNGGKSVKGHYKGFFFRSLLEYSFMKHLEQQGIDLRDVDYECFTIPYKIDDRDRTYRIDFYVPAWNKAFEVKQSYVLKTPKSTNVLKWAAARLYFEQRGIEFSIVTERDFAKVSFNDAMNDADVVWIQKTLEFFGKKTV